MAAALPSKVQDFLSDVQDINHPTEQERQKAIELLTETLRYRNATECNTHDELVETARRLKDLHVRLIDMNRRLELAKRVGLVSKSVH